MNRRFLISVSLLSHVGLGVFLFATGVWRIERLEGGRADLALAVMLPPAAQEGGPPPGEKPKDPVKKQPKKRAEDLVQLEQVHPEDVAKTASSTLTGTGLGEGSGAGSGSGTGTSPNPCDDCVGEGLPPDPTCGNNLREAGEACDDGNLLGGDGCSATCSVEPPKVNILPPTVFAGLRISGDTQIQAPDMVKTQMLRDGKDRAIGTIKVCIAVDGGISSVSMASSTKYPEYDARLIAAARGWRYRAYTVNGRPMPACSAVTFVYTIK